MPRSLDGAPERQPLLELQQDSAPVASVAVDSAPQQPGAGPPLLSAGAAPPEPAAGAAPMERLLSDKHCRYCLQGEEDGGQLEAPCKCAGSIRVRCWLGSQQPRRPA